MKNKDQFKHKSIFNCSISKASGAEIEEMIARASLEDIKKIFPADINLEENRDLIGIVLNAAVAGRMNKNGDAITKEDALKISKNFKNKYVNVEHKQENVIGCIVDVGFSKFGDNTLLTKEQIEDENFNEPFNISLAIVLWRSILSDESVDFIESSADPTSENYQKVSASWEIFYDDYDIAVGSKNVNEAEIITKKEDFSKYEKYLKARGGAGKKEDKYVYRVMKGESLLPAGIGAVSHPAADVLGLEIVTQEDNEQNNMKLNESSINELKQIIQDTVISIIKEQKEQSKSQKLSKAEMLCPDCEEEMEEDEENEEEMVCGKCGKKSMKSELKEKNISKSSETDVIKNNNQINLDKKIMKIKLKDAKDLTAEVLKMEAAVVQDAVAEMFQEGIKEANDKWLQEKSKYETDLNQAKERAEANERELKEFKENFSQVEKELKELKDKALAKEKQEKYNQRMEGFETEFELNDEIRQVLAADLSDISDEDYSKYAAKMKLFLPKKVEKAAASVEVKTEVKEEKKEIEKEISKEEKSLAAEKVISDAVKGAEKETEIPNTSETKTPSLFERMKKHFTLEEGFEVK